MLKNIKEIHVQGIHFNLEIFAYESYETLMRILPDIQVKLLYKALKNVVVVLSNKRN